MRFIVFNDLHKESADLRLSTRAGTHVKCATISAIEQWDDKRPDRPTGIKHWCNETICYKILVAKDIRDRIGAATPICYPLRMQWYRI